MIPVSCVDSDLLSKYSISYDERVAAGLVGLLCTELRPVPAYSSERFELTYAAL